MWRRAGRYAAVAAGGVFVGVRAGWTTARCEEAPGANPESTPTGWLAGALTSGRIPQLDYTPPFPTNPENAIVYFELAENGKPIGRVEFEVFDDESALLSVNFKALSTGYWKGLPILSKAMMHHRILGDRKQLTYLNTSFHKVQPGYMAIGGDNQTYVGKGGESFCGDLLKDSFKGKGGKIPGPGCLCAVNHARHTNRSQFFISYRALPHLERRNSCFGQVIKGFEVLKYIESTSSTSGMTKNEITIKECGIVKHKSGSLFDPFDPIAVPPQVEWNEKGAAGLTKLGPDKIEMLENPIFNYDYIAPTWMFDDRKQKTLTELSDDPTKTF